MTSIIIAGRPNSEEMSECIIVAENIANLYPSSRFTIVLKSPKEWEKYCEDLCNLFGISRKSHPLVLFSNGNSIGGQQEFFNLISVSFKYDKLIKKKNKKGEEWILDIDPSEITKLTQENTSIVEKEYICRTSGHYIRDKINEKLEKISDENFIKYYNKYNTIESDYENNLIEDMKVYVKYDNKFTPNSKDYFEYKDIIEQRPAYADKEKYNAYHEELRIKRETEERLKREAEEAAKKKLEEEQRLKEEALRAAEEAKLEAEGNEKTKNKAKEKRKREEEKKRKKEEEERKRKEKEEEERKKKEEEERLKKEEEERIKKEEEEKKKLENELNEGEKKEGEEENVPEEEQQKVITYKRIFFKCYSDFDIPYDKFDKEILVETFKTDNFELLVNPYFTFFGETLINTIEDYEAPLLPERETPVIEEEIEEPLPDIIGQVVPTDGSKGPVKTQESAKDKQNENKKVSSKNNTEKNFNKKNENDNNKKDSVTNPQQQQQLQKNDEIKTDEATEVKKNLGIPEGKIGGPTTSEEPNTYKPNFTNEKKPKDQIVIKDYGRLPSLRILKFEGEDLRFYQEYIPPYQLTEHIKNTSNLFNFSQDVNLIESNILTSVIEMINETDGYAIYKVLPYNYSEWKKYGSNKFRILPHLCKDIKNDQYPLVEKIAQQKKKFKRELFKSNFQKEGPDGTKSTAYKNTEIILHNPDFEFCFEIPEYFSLDIYKKHKIPHLIKTFSKELFVVPNVKYAINKMAEKLKINNNTGFGFCLIISKEFIFMAPIKEPYTFTKEIPENKEKNEPAVPSIPIFAEPYYFMGIFTLPYIESEWPESIKNKNVKFDLIEILKKTTN